MKLLRLFFIIFFIIFSNQIKAEEGDLKNKITKNLRCLICQGQSVYDSDSEFANSLKIVVNKKLDEGFSENFNKNTYFLWLLPLLIFLIGGAIIFKKFIKKHQ